MALTYTLKNGNTVTVAPFDTASIRELFEVFAEYDATRAEALLRRALPGISKADWMCLAAYGEDVAAVLRLAGGFTAPSTTPPWPH